MRIIQTIGILACLVLAGCHVTGRQIKQAVIPLDAQIVKYHIREHKKSLEEFTRRLYLKNPKYENALEAREKKIQGIFHSGELPHTDFNDQPSHKILEAAFEKDPGYSDRVYLLSLGLAKAIKETYGAEEDLLLTSMELSLTKLKRLYYNISHVNWRLKVYRDEQDDLLFQTNEIGQDGYINMGYEVIMTEIMTRIKDDIVMRGGMPQKMIFDMSTLFLTILL